MRFSRTSSTTDWKQEEVHITGLSHDGRGLARHQGKTLFVEGALEQETVTVRPVKTHRKYIDAKVKQVKTASSERCQPACSHFNQCGGCSLQYWSHDGQLQGKQRIVLDQLRRFASVEPEQLMPSLVSSPYGYRYRCRLAIKWKKGQLQLGFREQQSQAICDIHECPVLAEPLQDIPQALRFLLLELKVKEAVSHAELFSADNGRAVILRTIRNLSAQDKTLLKQAAVEYQWRLFLQDNDRQLHCLYTPDGDERLYYRLPDFDLKLSFKPLDFTQVNQPVNRKMVSQAIDWMNLMPGERVLDLFCGLGNFSLPIARKTGQVTGVEGGGSAVQRATENARLNGLSDCCFFQADLSAAVAHQPWAKETYDALLLDPPRAGAQELITALSAALPPKILYVACNPATLARDAGLLSQQGYKLKRLGVMDMFPQTAHIESMALFER